MWRRQADGEEMKRKDNNFHVFHCTYNEWLRVNKRTKRATAQRQTHLWMCLSFLLSSALSFFLRVFVFFLPQTKQTHSCLFAPILYLFGLQNYIAQTSVHSSISIKWIECIAIRYIPFTKSPFTSLGECVNALCTVWNPKLWLLFAIINIIIMECIVHHSVRRRRSYVCTRVSCLTFRRCRSRCGM